ncbi:hypothetical protein [Anaerovibrio lipolyticus]|uniref:hypothetical protein n=1 Tax=Anaerovibrio lipolyticus TaxID=82374 RepID=UPI0013629F0B|nr:hypothetical protein [Anaerovibrio lipolyticus]
MLADIDMEKCYVSMKKYIVGGLIVKLSDLAKRILPELLTTVKTAKTPTTEAG